MPTYSGTNGNDSITGSNSSDRIDGGAGNDTISGGAGNDTIVGGAGNDVIDAGSGSDRISFYDGYGTDRVTGGADAGGGDADMLDIDITSKVSVVFTGSDTGSFTSTGAGNGTVQFIGIESVWTGAGDDLIDARASASNQTLAGYFGGDTILGGSGNDTIRGEDGADSLSGGRGNDRIEGGTGNDTIQGGAGNDVLSGDSGTDTVDYSDATAGVSVDLGANTTGGWAAGDTISGFEGVIGSNRDDVLRGSTSGDTLSGGGGGDTLFGDAGDDVLYGGQGADWLGGGAGADTLTGGEGADTFDLNAREGSDVITDFDMSDPDNDGRTSDQLDVSDLLTANGDPVRTKDVTITTDLAGNAVLTFPMGESVTLVGVSEATLRQPQQLYRMGIPCFTSGTLISTPDGVRPVENIAAGDLVLTRDRGFQPVLWAGSSPIAAISQHLHPNLRPVCIAAGAFGNRTALRVSQQHAFILPDADGHPWLVRARHLAEFAPRLARFEEPQDIAYHHLLLARHEVIFAAGAPTESMYPGPAVRRMLGARLWADIARVLPRLAWLDDEGTHDTVEALYGPRIHPLLDRRTARRMLVRGIAPARPQGPRQAA